MPLLAPRTTDQVFPSQCPMKYIANSNAVALPTTTCSKTWVSLLEGSSPDLFADWMPTGWIPCVRFALAFASCMYSAIYRLALSSWAHWGHFGFYSAAFLSCWCTGRLGGLWSRLDSFHSGCREVSAQVDHLLKMNSAGSFLQGPTTWWARLWILLVGCEGWFHFTPNSGVPESISDNGPMLAVQGIYQTSKTPFNTPFPSYLVRPLTCVTFSRTIADPNAPDMAPFLRLSLELRSFIY